MSLLIRNRIRILALLALSFCQSVSQAQEYSFVEGAGGLPMAVAQWGNPQGPNVLLLHGAGFSKEYWIEQRSATSDDCARYVAMDLRGHGASGKPWTSEQIINSQLWADDIQAVMTAYDMRDVVLVGWSYGGYVAMDYVRHYGSANLAGLLLVGSAAGLVERPEFDGEPPSGFLEAAAKRNSLNLSDNADGARYVTGLMSSFPLSDATSRSWTMQMASMPVYFKRFMSGRDLDNADIIDTLNMPVSFLLGGKDLSVSLTAIEKLIETRLSGAHLRVSPEAGHAVSHDDTVAFFQTLGALLPAVVQTHGQTVADKDETPTCTFRADDS